MTHAEQAVLDAARAYAASERAQVELFDAIPVAERSGCGTTGPWKPKIEEAARDRYRRSADLERAARKLGAQDRAKAKRKAAGR